ncbi:hypothetical protein QN277_029054 [Acacia crassicarpa]|uniref:Phytosulfokine n=1 Tax=Acacia crassicarpa TaxID=499986 RepID=A0AAE1J4Q5_9FABA|nr:hypothetical protein QN277_029054 [Acacia crassicarpa]
MAKSVVLIFIISLVLCVSEGRVISPDSDPHRSVHNPPYLAASSPEQSRHNDFDDQLCKGLGREECLVRKTLAAHTDYIYTQDTNGP